MHICPIVNETLLLDKFHLTFISVCENRSLGLDVLLLIDLQSSRTFKHIVVTNLGDRRY